MPRLLYPAPSLLSSKPAIQITVICLTIVPRNYISVTSHLCLLNPEYANHQLGADLDAAFGSQEEVDVFCVLLEACRLIEDPRPLRKVFEVIFQIH